VELTIGQLAERTGTQAGTLRMWESRYGFPRARRLPSGHRRYAETDVERVLEVLGLRASGLSLRAAIERVQAAPQLPASIFASVLGRIPELASHPLPKRVLLPMSNAMLDEACAGAERGVLIGSFQEERFYRQSERRWRPLARTAELSFVLADFGRARAPRAGAAEVPVDRSHPLSREWAVIWDAPSLAVFLAARERVDPDAPDRERIFDTVWSLERRAVRHAARTALELARGAAPELSLSTPQRLEAPLDPDAEVARRTTALTNRMLAYVGATQPRT
jgi:DICT domain-containing protein